MRARNSVITIIGSADTVIALRHWFDDRQPYQGRRARNRVTVRLEPIREFSAQATEAVEPAATAESTAALVDA